MRVLDIESRLIVGLRGSKVCFYEPGLPDLLSRGLFRRRIVFSRSYSARLSGARFPFVCVPTRCGNDGPLDHNYLRTAFAAVRDNAAGQKINCW